MKQSHTSLVDKHIASSRIKGLIIGRWLKVFLNSFRQTDINIMTDKYQAASLDLSEPSDFKIPHVNLAFQKDSVKLP